ncbi:MAG TPA: hypothetical protein VGI93_21240 [Steroidobacteraceae bacterium]|jgi:hypothetical protein
MMKTLLFVCALAAPLTGIGATSESARLSVEKQIALGAPDHWDYLSVDAAAQRLYVSHGTSIEVLDAISGKNYGKVEVAGANGVVALSGINKGYAGSRTGKEVVIFDLKSLKAIKTLPADEDTDAVVYDPKSARVFVMQGDPHSITVVETQRDTVAGTVKLDGQPEFAAADGEGHLFVNIVDKSELQRINTATLASEAIWPISGCERPHGAALDSKLKRIFVGCVNQILYVVDAVNGSVVARVPIGKGSDAIAFDPVRQLVFSSNGEGTVTVVKERSASDYVVLGNPATAATARTMAVEPGSGRLYFTAANQALADPVATDPRKKFRIEPGSVRVLFATLQLNP